MKAFPQKYPIDADEPHHWRHNPLDRGMNLRDYFAAKIVQAMITNHKIERLHPDEKSIVIDAYIVADLMMEARNESI
jgi:hypothetical protein